MNIGGYYSTEVRECFNIDFRNIMVISICEESLCKHVIPAMHVLFLQVIPFLASLLPNGYVSVYKHLAYGLSSEFTAGEFLKVSVTRPRI